MLTAVYHINSWNCGDRAHPSGHTGIWRNVNHSEFVMVRFMLSSGAEFLSSRLLSKNLKIKIYRTVILPVVLYGCETWSLTLQEERKLRVYENMVLRRVFGPRRDEVTGEWGRLHN